MPFRATLSDILCLVALSKFQVAYDTFGVPSIPSEGLGKNCRSKKLLSHLIQAISNLARPTASDTYINFSIQCPNEISRTTRQESSLEVSSWCHSTSLIHAILQVNPATVVNKNFLLVVAFLLSQALLNVKLFW